MPKKYLSKNNIRKQLVIQKNLPFIAIRRKIKNRNLK